MTPTETRTQQQIADELQRLHDEAKAAGVVPNVVKVQALQLEWMHAATANMVAAGIAA